MSVYQRGRRKVWYARFMHKGERFHYPLEGATNKTEAKAMEERDRARLKAGVLPSVPPQDSPTEQPEATPVSEGMRLSAAADRMFREKWRRNATGEEVRRKVDNLIAMLGTDPDITQLDSERITNIIEMLENRLNSPATVNRYLAPIRTILRRAFRVWRVLDHEPLIEMASESGRERERVLSEEDITALSEWMREHNMHARADMCWFLLDTGARLGETRKLEWRDVDLDNKRIRFVGENTKNDTTRHLSMSKRVERILRRHKAQGFERPFPVESSACQYAIRKAREELGAADRIDPEGVCWHAFRHTCASRLTEKGVGQHRVVKWMGWKTPAMFSRYAHLMPGAFDEVASVVDNWAS